MRTPSFKLRAATAAVLSMLALGSAQAAGFRGSFGKVTGGHLMAPTSVVGVSPSVTALTDLVMPVTGVVSFDDDGAPGNVSLNFAAIPGALVDAISWNVTLRTNGESWLSEATILVTNSNGDGVYFAPGAGDDFSGTASYSFSGLLSDYALGFNVLGDGVINLYFYEDYDDLPGAADAVYIAGNVTLGAIGVSPVPEPATYGLMALGLLGVVGAARRRAA